LIFTQILTRDASRTISCCFDHIIVKKENLFISSYNKNILLLFCSAKKE
jgi:hypothetical protein